MPCSPHKPAPMPAIPSFPRAGGRQTPGRVHSKMSATRRIHRERLSIRGRTGWRFGVFHSTRVLAYLESFPRRRIAWRRREFTHDGMRPASGSLRKPPDGQELIKVAFPQAQTAFRRHRPCAGGATIDRLNLLKPLLGASTGLAPVERRLHGFALESRSISVGLLRESAPFIQAKAPECSPSIIAPLERVQRWRETIGRRVSLSIILPPARDRR